GKTVELRVRPRRFASAPQKKCRRCSSKGQRSRAVRRSASRLNTEHAIGVAVDAAADVVVGLALAAVTGGAGMDGERIEAAEGAGRVQQGHDDAAGAPAAVATVATVAAVAAGTARRLLYPADTSFLSLLPRRAIA